jgi:hypothetical protein
LTGPYFEKPSETAGTVAPAVVLAAWMREHGVTVDELAARMAALEETRLAAAQHVRAVLAREPITPGRADLIEAGTGISAGIWLLHERMYRNDLVQGRTDTTPADLSIPRQDAANG